MDRDVTVRFFQVTGSDAQEPLETVIRKIGGIASKREIERELGNGIRLRLERFESHDDDIFTGDLTRIQTENLPSKVTDDDTDPLPFEELEQIQFTPVHIRMR